MAKVKADQRAAEVAAWRASHFDQLEKSLQAAIAIRDDPDTSAKDRNESIKIIGRLLDAMSPEKSGAARPPEKKDAHKPTDEEMAIIMERLNA